MSFRDRLGREMLLFDGAMGTQLQSRGLAGGELPETWNILHPDTVYSIHKSYVEAGCDILKTNTFGANALKFQDPPYTVPALVEAGVTLAKRAAKEAGREVLVALDMGPTGKLLKPSGELEFCEAYKLYKEQVVAGAKAGADLVLIETMGDLYEIKAAVLAAKENSDLPVVVTMIFNENGKLLTGADIPTALFTLEGLGVDMIGFNCGLGPRQMLPFVQEILKYTSTPIAVNPNAVFEIASLPGVQAVGGCCGTTPDHLHEAVKKCKPIAPQEVKEKDFTAVTSYSKTVFLADKPVIIGERINPTGKKRLKQALPATPLMCLNRRSPKRMRAPMCSTSTSVCRNSTKRKSCPKPCRRFKPL